MSKANISPVAPNSIPAEQAVIGAILCNPAAYVHVNFLSPGMFFSVRHSLIWNGIQQLARQDTPLDYLTLCNQLKATDDLDKIGGPAYITELVNNTPTSTHAPVYAQFVQSAAMRRALLILGDTIKDSAIDEDKPVDSVLAMINTELKDIQDRQYKPQMSAIADLLPAFMDRVEHRIDGAADLPAITTGYNELDDLIDGFLPGELVFIAGRPSMGKTALAQNLLLNSNTAGGLFSLEMNREQVLSRLIALQSARIPGDGLDTRLCLFPRRMTTQQQTSYHRACSELAKRPLHLDCTPGVRPSHIARITAEWRLQADLRLIVIDGLWLMKPDGRHDRHDLEVGSITHALKELAESMQITVVLTHQLSRGVESRNDKHPTLGDLRDSGDCEQDADKVLFPFRPIYYNPLSMYPHLMELTVAKNRNGKTGMTQLYFEEITTKVYQGVKINKSNSNHKPLKSIEPRAEERY